MTNENPTRERGYFTLVTLTPDEASELAQAAVDHATQALDYARDDLAKFTGSVIRVDEEPRWNALADAVSTLETVVRELRAVQRLGGAREIRTTPGPVA